MKNSSNPLFNSQQTTNPHLKAAKTLNSKSRRRGAGHHHQNLRIEEKETENRTVQIVQDQIKISESTNKVKETKIIEESSHI